MKRLLIAALLTTLPLSVMAVDTAYTALRVVGKRGEDSLNKVAEVKGRFGAPEPQMWKITLLDSGARSGIREFEVQHGQVTGERAPSGRVVTGAALDLGKLNIDSDGAFTIANQEAQKAGQPFDRIDYTLSGGRSGAPVWRLELFTKRNGRAGEIEVAADSGTVLRRDLHLGDKTNPAPDDRAYLRDHPAPDAGPRVAPDADPPDRHVYVEDEELGPGITDLFGKIGRHFQKRSKQLKNFFEH